VLGALLGALTPKDTINVAACDVNCDWAFEKPVSATRRTSRRTAIPRERSSLGWTDLDKAFASALKATDAGTHVVYLGDGTQPTGTADPVAFADRLRKLTKGSGTFHAVALGSSYEPAALKAIASLGNGSLRRVASDRTRRRAFDLLTEIAPPSLRDLKVEFTGLRTARVYPRRSQTCRPGTQQILLGRYLPKGRSERRGGRHRARSPQAGALHVDGRPEGRRAGELVRPAAVGPDAPRPVARTGPSESVKQDVIALSEEFHIITRTRRSWCWRPTPTGPGSRSAGGSACATARSSSPGARQRRPSS
jgi:hypothetical protein